MDVAQPRDIGKKIVTNLATTIVTVRDGGQENEIALEESIGFTILIVTRHHPHEATTIAIPKANINWVINTDAEPPSLIIHAIDTSTTTHEAIEVVGKQGDKRV